MSRLRTQSPNPSKSDESAAQASPAQPSVTVPELRTEQATDPRSRTTWMLLMGWIGVMLVLYLAGELYRQPAQGKVQAHGVLEIARGRDGHFRVNGAVNGVPVQFMVDTGASIISITDKVAERAQLPEGVPIQFQTANGVREGTMHRADRIDAGPLTVNNLRVGTGYTGESEKDALLGQNFLRYFDVTMVGDVMRLTARDENSQ